MGGPRNSDEGHCCQSTICHRLVRGLKVFLLANQKLFTSDLLSLPFLVALTSPNRITRERISSRNMEGELKNHPQKRTTIGQVLLVDRS